MEGQPGARSTVASRKRSRARPSSVIRLVGPLARAARSRDHRRRCHLAEADQPQPGDLHAVSFANASTGGRLATLARSWPRPTEVPRGGPATVAVQDDLLGLYFADPARGWAVGRTARSCPPRMAVPVGQSATAKTPFDLHGVLFVDAMRGWAAGANGTLQVTSDGGVTWQAKDSGDGTPFLGPGPGWPVACLGRGCGRVGPVDHDTGHWSDRGGGHLPDMRAALRSIDIAADRIGQPMTDFAAADADLTERALRLSGNGLLSRRFRWLLRWRGQSSRRRNRLSRRGFTIRCC